MSPSVCGRPRPDRSPAADVGTAAKHCERKGEDEGSPTGRRRFRSPGHRYEPRQEQESVALLQIRVKTEPPCCLSPTLHGFITPRPKVLGLIKQRRLAAREEVQAVMHTLSLAGLELRKPERILRPPDLKSGETRLTDASLGPMLWHTESGAAQWDVVLPEDLQELRVVLAPDEGGPLWSGFQWLAKQGYRIGFLPDLLSPVSRLINNN